MSKKVEQAIKDFITKKETNRKNVTFDTVLNVDKAFVEDFLGKFYDAFKLFFKNEDTAEEIFCSKLSTLTAIRFDSVDQNLEPLNGAYDDMRKMNNGKLDGGLCYVGDGFNAILDLDMMTHTKEEATHTCIHEVIHLMSLINMKNHSNETIYKIGLCVDQKDQVARFVNEGFTEKLAQIMWSRMYPKEKCPGVGRYALNVKTIDLILGQLGNQDEVIEDYFVDANLVIEAMKNQVDLNNKDLYTFVHEIGSQDIGNVNVQKQFEKDIKTFVYSNKNIVHV